jgi:hypothetical protein
VDLRPFALVILVATATPAAAAPALNFPLDCTIGSTCEVQHYMDDDPGPGVRDYRGGRRTYEGHNGIDLRVKDMATAAKTAVLAAAPGRVARLRDGVADVSIRAEGAPSVKGQECGNGVVIDHGDGWETQYCHLARGSITVKVGDQVKPGQPIARVGLSGDTEFAHLHLSVRHGSTVIDPFAPGPGAAPLWTPAAMTRLAYKAGAVLNAGFASGPVEMPALEAGAPAAPGREAPYLVAYVRAIELESGDVVELVLKGPGGAVLAQNQVTLDRDKAQYMRFVGKKRPATGWPAGRYEASYQVRRGGKTVIARDFTQQF